MKRFRLVTFLGIRPDLIRMHKLIKLLDAGQKKYNFEHIFVHSGQHFDYELDKVFYKELGIREPDINLNIGKILKKRGKTSQAYQSALLFEKTDELMKKIKPNAVMYLGDTNTITSSIIVAKNNISVIHIEGGGRSYDWRMPEEKNRIIIDHLSDRIYSYLPHYKDKLISEGIPEFRIKVVGNIIVDAIKSYIDKADKNEILKTLGVKEKQFLLLTLHREENISDKNILKWKLENTYRFAKEMNIPVVFPLMPRTKQMIEKFKLSKFINNSFFITTKPLGFLEFLKCEKAARLIVSDSGTVQEEALIVGTPCVVARRSTERPETIWAKATILEGFEGEDTLYNKMLEAYHMKTNWKRNILNPYNGSPSERIYVDLMEQIKNNYFEKSRNFEIIKDNMFVRKAYNL
jgi:UDP-N-acetylglucosamine 2-epimerase (non-hydrolysing)